MHAINALIVEDEVLIAETIKFYLNERGHHAIGMAISFDEAIENIETKNPDIIILDIRLYGDQSGIDVAKYLQKEKADIPYIIVSAQFSSKYIEQAFAVGASGFLTKPIKKENLWSTIELAVGKNNLKLNDEKFIDIRIKKGFQRIYLNDIQYIKSDHVYLEIVCNDSKFYFRSTLENILNKIAENDFIRCHRSYIINTRKIKKFSSNSVSIGHHIIPVSPKYNSSLQSYILDKQQM